MQAILDQLDFEKSSVTVVKGRDEILWNDVLVVNQENRHMARITENVHATLRQRHKHFSVELYNDQRGIEANNGHLLSAFNIDSEQDVITATQKHLAC